MADSTSRPRDVVPCWHAAAVDIGTFWDIIEAARASAGPGRPFHESLTDHLATLTEQDILEYYERFEKMREALYRHDLWAAAYLIGGGCSDDGFIDFRAGLIAQGRDWYQNAVVSPDSLAGHPAVADDERPRCDNPLFYEEVNYAAPYAFERVSGDEHAFWAALKARGPRDLLPLMGEDFDFYDDQEMRRRLPRLSGCCLGSSPTTPPIVNCRRWLLRCRRTGDDAVGGRGCGGCGVAGDRGW